MKLLIVAVLILSVISSCTSTQNAQPTGKVQQEVPVQKVVVETPKFDCNPCLVKLVAIAPEQTSLNSEYKVTAELTGLENAGDIVVSSRNVQGATYVQSTPPAEVADGKLVWKIDFLRKGETQKIDVTYRADQQGAKVCCFALVSAKPLYCAVTAVGKSELAIEKTGPATALMNQDISYTITVKNTGNAPATNVQITDEIPEGLVHAEGKTVIFKVGTLEPNDSKTFQVPVKTTTTGRFCNVATLTSADLASPMKAEACTDVKSQDIQLMVECSPMVYLKGLSKDKITVSNAGQTPLTGVKIVASTDPEKVSIVEPAGFANGQIVLWENGTLDAGAKQEIEFRTKSGISGKHCTKVIVTTSEGLSKEMECCTDWQGIPAMLLEVVDDPDPVQVGDTTTYTITITNQGTKEDTNILMEVIFPAEVEPVQVTGQDGVEGKIEGNKVIFAPYPRLDPKAKITYKIIGKGKVAGDSRSQFFLKTDFISNSGKPPVTETESTNIY